MQLESKVRVVKKREIYKMPESEEAETESEGEIEALVVYSRFRRGHSGC